GDGVAGREITAGDRCGRVQKCGGAGSAENGLLGCVDVEGRGEGVGVCVYDRGAEKGRDVDGGAGLREGDAEWEPPVDEWEGDRVIAGIEGQGESAGGGGDHARWASAEAGGGDKDVVGGSEEHFCVEGREGDVGEVAENGGGVERESERKIENRKGDES